MSNNDWQQGPSDPNQPHQQPQQPVDSAWGEPQQNQFQNQPPNQPPVHQPGSNASLDNNDFIALALSWFFPGVGQIMLGQKTKGIVILVVSIMTCYLGGILGFASLLDTFCLAKARKKRPVDDWEFFPDLNDAF